MYQNGSFVKFVKWERRMYYFDNKIISIVNSTFDLDINIPGGTSYPPFSISWVISACI